MTLLPVFNDEGGVQIVVIKCPKFKSRHLITTARCLIPTLTLINKREHAQLTMEPGLCFRKSATMLASSHKPYHM